MLHGFLKSVILTAEADDGDVPAGRRHGRLIGASRGTWRLRLHTPRTDKNDTR